MTGASSGEGSGPAPFASAAMPARRAGLKATIALYPPVIPLCQMTRCPSRSAWCQARPISLPAEITARGIRAARITSPNAVVSGSRHAMSSRDRSAAVEYSPPAADMTPMCHGGTGRPRW